MALISARNRIYQRNIIDIGSNMAYVAAKYSARNIIAARNVASSAWQRRRSAISGAASSSRIYRQRISERKHHRNGLSAASARSMAYGGGVMT